MVTAPHPTATATQEDPAQPVLVFDDVSIGFEGKKVLENISLSVSPGDTRILLGPAGSGKSVLLKLANGLIRPDSGTITVFGEEINNMREEQLFELRGRIGMVFQEGALFDSLTVRDNVAYRLMEQKVPEAEVTAAGDRGASLRGTGADAGEVSITAFGRYAPPGGDCPGDC